VVIKIRHKEEWTPERRQYVLDELAKGRIIPDIAKELLVAPGQLRAAMRYYGYTKTKPTTENGEVLCTDTKS